MDFGCIIGTIGNMLGGGKKTADGAQTGGLQDIIANLGLGDLSNINPQDIISKFQNGELSLDQAQAVLKQLAATLGLEDKLGEYLSMLKKN